MKKKKNIFKMYGNVEFHLNVSNLDDEVDREYEDKVDTLIERIITNSIVIQYVNEY